jgi:predicted aspartyl protease
MGRILTSVTVASFPDQGKTLRVDALVDTGAAHLVLPSAWRERLGDFASETDLELLTGDQRVVTGKLCGPASIAVEGFRQVYNEVLFLDMEEENGYQALLGYIVLEQCGAAVDMLGHRLVPVKYMDLK